MKKVKFDKYKRISVFETLVLQSAELLIIWNGYLKFWILTYYSSTFYGPGFKKTNL